MEELLEPITRKSGVAFFLYCLVKCTCKQDFQLTWILKDYFPYICLWKYNKKLGKIYLWKYRKLSLSVELSKHVDLWQFFS